MEYKVEEDLRDFPAWAGGKDTLDVLIEKGDCDEVQSLIEDMFCGGHDVPADTEINDFLWFDRDTIAEHLGYKDWDAYEAGWSEEDVEDAEAWFPGTDFDTMERISGLRRGDFSDEDGYQDFVDAVQEWWDSLDDSEKVTIYYDND